MGIDPRQLRDYVVRPALETLGLPGGEVAERLVMGTAAHESDGFRYIHQVKGPALGLWQIEPATAKDAFNRSPSKFYANLLKMNAVTEGFNRSSLEEFIEQLAWNLRFAAAACRLVYFLKPFSLPQSADVTDLARIWKVQYNSIKGRGKESQFIANWNKYLSDVYPVA